MALKHKQEAFCQGVVDGLSDLSAYRACCDCADWTDASCSTEAWKLKQKPEIIQRIADLRAKLEELQILPRATRLKVLAEIVTRNARKLTDEDRIKTARDNDVIAAIKAYGEMVGDNAPQKLTIEHSGETTQKTINIIRAEDIEQDAD
jgi:hypothetical protein